MRKQSAVQWPSHLSIPPHQAWVWLLHTWTKCSEIKHKTSPRRCSRRSVCMHKHTHTHTGKRRLWVCLFALSCDGLRRARVTIPLVACLCPPTNIKYECTHGSCVLYDDVCWDTPTIIFIYQLLERRATDRQRGCCSTRPWMHFLSSAQRRPHNSWSLLVLQQLMC
jgi:hypothetical protein